MIGDYTTSLDILDLRTRVLLPEDYEDSYDVLEPKPMRSAPLAFDEFGRVAWDVIWGGFCDLALAGGPPHKGTLLRPASSAQVAADPARHAKVTSEICRGITMATLLEAEPSPAGGWIRVDCRDEVSASWLLRAIVVENVAVYREGPAIFLPAGPHFRLQKEIKNVVTVIAKTAHYWSGHMSGLKRQAVRRTLAEIRNERPLIAPPVQDGDTADAQWHLTADRLAESIAQRTGIHCTDRTPGEWLGLACPSANSAVWMMRALVVSNVLSRREEKTLYVPVNPRTDPSGAAVAGAVQRLWQLAVASRKA